MLSVFVFVSVLTLYLSLWISDDSQIKEDRRGNSHLYFKHKLRLTPDQGGNLSLSTGTTVEMSPEDMAIDDLCS